MKESKTREKILKNIRNALIYKSDNPFPNIDFESPIYKPLEDSLDIAFAQALLKVSGEFIFCENKEDLLKNLQALIFEKKCKNIYCQEEEIMNILSSENIAFHQDEEKFLTVEASITGCEYLIARLGSVMVSSKQTKSRRIVCFPPVHIVIAYSHQLVPDIKDAFSGMKEKYGSNLPSLISLITGPSRTADIEKTLVMGAHGPKELYVFLIDEKK